jgi:hypothetical protein
LLELAARQRPAGSAQPLVQVIAAIEAVHVREGRPPAPRVLPGSGLRLPRHKDYHVSSIRGRRGLRTKDP